jgi:hypothetical protein
VCSCKKSFVSTESSIDLCTRLVHVDYVAPMYISSLNRMPLWGSFPRCSRHYPAYVLKFVGDLKVKILVTG